MTMTWDDLRTAGASIEPGNLDAEETALNRLYRQFQADQTWIDLVEVLAVASDRADDQQATIKAIRSIDAAGAAQLAELGEAIDLPRNGLDDEQYRGAIKVEIQTLTSSGTIPEILTATRSLFADGRSIGMIERYPAAFTLRVAYLDDTQLQLFLAIMCDMPSSGVRAVLETDDPPTMGGWGYTGATLINPGIFGYTGAADPGPSLWTYSISFSQDC